MEEDLIPEYNPDEIIQEYKDLLEESKELTDKYLSDLKNVKIQNSKLKNELRWKNLVIIGLSILTVIFILL